MKNVRSDKVRFVVIGLATNVVAFCLFLILVLIGVSPKRTLTLLYWTSVVLVFFINRAYVFGHKGNIFHAFKKHICVYIFGYGLSISMLAFWLDYLGLNYVVAMIMTSIVMPVYFYTMQKHLVFR
jgi:putative flippase GtrA